MKEQHFSLSDEAFIHQFVTKTIRPEWFSHIAHVRLGWLYVSKYGVEKANSMLCKQILDFDIHFGKGKVYNETITVAYAHIIHEREANAYTNFEAFLEANYDLVTNAKSILAKHYSYDILQNEIAKKTYLPPDLKPFE